MQSTCLGKQQMLQRYKMYQPYCLHIYCTIIHSTSVDYPYQRPSDSNLSNVCLSDSRSLEMVRGITSGNEALHAGLAVYHTIL